MKTKILIAVIAIGLFTTSPVLAQEKEQAKMENEQMEKATYTCPMHAEVKSDKPGEGPECGMALVEKKMNKMMMKHDSTKMNMKHNKMDHKKMDHSKMAKTYVCPMHSEVTGDNAGECSKCGMALIEKKMDKKMNMKKENKHRENKIKTKSCC